MLSTDFCETIHQTENNYISENCMTGLFYLFPQRRCCGKSVIFGANARLCVGVDCGAFLMGCVWPARTEGSGQNILFMGDRECGQVCPRSSVKMVTRWRVISVWSCQNSYVKQRANVVSVCFCVGVSVLLPEAFRQN